MFRVSARYISRPAISNERLRDNKAGQAALKLKTAYRNGTAHTVPAPIVKLRSHVVAAPALRVTFCAGQGGETGHRRTVLSDDPEARVRPSGEKATLLTLPPCPLRVAMVLPLATSHRRTVLS